MKINLLDRCLICLDKTENGNSSSVISSSSTYGSITQMTFANKVLPQLLVERTTEKEENIRRLFNQIQFCSPGGDNGGGDHDLVEGQRSEESSSSSSSSAPPLCSSCSEKLSSLIQLMEQLQLKTKEIQGKISGGDGGAFQNLLKGSEMVEEETKRRTLLLLDCLREECCEGASSEPRKETNDDEGRSGGEEEQTINLDDEEESDDEDDEEVVELPVPPPKEVPVVDISSDDENVEGMEKYDLDMIRPDDMLVVEINPEDILRFQESPDDVASKQVMIDEDEVVEVPQSSSSINELNPAIQRHHGKIYTHSRYLGRHLEVNYRPPSVPPKRFSWRCDYCGKGYHDSTNLKYHVESQHLRLLK